MPLYIGDFVADTMHLSAIEIGIYVQLLMHCWQHESISSDPKILARIAHCDPRTFHLHAANVLRFFERLDPSTMQQECYIETYPTMHHKRVTAELHRSRKLSSKRKEAAMQMHEKRKGNNGAQKDASAQDLLAYAHAGLQSQSQKKEEKKKDAGALPRISGVVVSVDPDADLFRRGREILGDKAGGVISKLKVRMGSVAKARAVLEQASEKHNPREYVGRIIRDGEPKDDLPNPIY